MSQNLMNWLNSPLPFQPIYYVVGEEVYLISEIRKTFMNKIHKEQGMADFNQDDLDAKNTNFEKLISALEILPMMSEKRLVFFQNAECLKEEDWQKLESFIDNPVPSTVFVCFFNKLDRRKKFFKKLQKKGIGLSAEVLKDWETSAWIEYLAKKFDLKISSSNKTLFSQLVGTGLMEMRNEMNKLKTYMGEKKEVTEEDLIAVVSKMKIDSVFDLTDAIGKKDLVQSLAYLAYLLEHNQNEIGALALVARHMRILARFQEAKKQKWPKSKTIALAGISPYFFQNYLKQSELWSEDQITKMMEILFEVDKALKSSPLSSHIWMENFILQACS